MQIELPELFIEEWLYLNNKTIVLILQDIKITKASKA